MLKVGFTGAHGVGKTTLCSTLEQMFVARGVLVVRTPEVPRQIVQEVGNDHFFRRRNNTPAKQFLIMIRQLLVESPNTNGVVLCDRTLLDHWCYTIALFSELADSETMHAWTKMVHNYLASYDMLFYIPIEFAPLDDGIREGDAGFQNRIDALISENLTASRHEYKRVTGTIAHRAELCFSLITDRL